MKKNISIIAFLFAMLLYSSWSNDMQGQKKFDVVSYNVLEGFKSDSLNIDTYVDWISDIDPDVVAYQEMNKFSQKDLEKLAKRYGHPYAVMSKFEGFPVAISSKHPIVNVQKVVDNMWHAFLHVQIKDIHFFVIHYSPFDYKKRQEEMKLVLAHAATLPKDSKILIMGDFNSLDKSDAIHHTDEMLKNLRAREEKQAHIRNLNNGEIDYSVLQLIKDAGFIDTFWLTNDKSMYSATTTKYGVPKNRIDFMWASPAMAKKVTNSTIIHDDKTNVMSDHYPVYVQFDLDK